MTIGCRALPRFLWLGFGALAPAANAAVLVGALAPLQPGLDYHSFANIEQFRVTHLELALKVDFSDRTIEGSVDLEIERLDPNATELILDTRDIDVRDVTAKAQNVLGATSKSEIPWISRPYHFERQDPILGSALVIELPPSKQRTLSIRIDYETSPDAAGLRWISSKEGAGTPFLYTQSAALGSRSWIPMQDTPQVRVTYTATIHTARGMVALMSAINDPKAKRHGDFHFVMPERIPASMIALAVGDLKFRETGTRSGVYAVQSQIKDAAREFSDTEALLAAGEKFLGPYRFGRLDLVLMPASFPVAAIGHPRLAFVSPTVLAGDVAPVAAAVAHSWSGDLVGNATWRDLWLSEGISDYLASRLVTAVYGEQRDLLERALAPTPPTDQPLAIDWRNRDPAAGLAEGSFEKGRLFLRDLAGKFGLDPVDAFLRDYVDHFAFQNITTEQFMAYLNATLLERHPGLVTPAEITAWVTSPGIPAAAPPPAPQALAAVDQARAAWLTSAVRANKLPTSPWLTPQWIYFLDGMPALTATQLADLDQTFALTRSANAEILESWLMLVIRNHYQPGVVRLEGYLRTVGRTRLIAPLYRELMNTPAGATEARRVYRLARAFYSPETVAVIDTIVVSEPDDREPLNE